MDCMGGGSADTKGTIDEVPPGDTASDSVSKRVSVNEAEEKEEDLHYLDEDQDE